LFCRKNSHPLRYDENEKTFSHENKVNDEKVLPSNLAETVMIIIVMIWLLVKGKFPTQVFSLSIRKQIHMQIKFCGNPIR
jgi:hypothetical protein